MGPRIAQMIAKSDDYLIADMDNGSVRIGMLGLGLFFDFVPSDPMHERIKNLRIEDAEDCFDELYAAYLERK